MIEGYGTANAGNFQLEISCDFNIANDECDDAFPIVCGDVVTGTTQFATNSAGEPSNDVFYTFQGTGTAETVTLSLCGSGTTFDSYLRVFSDCNGTEIAQNNDSCGDQSEVSFESDGTSIYYIMVEGNGSSAGNFSMSINCEELLGVSNNETFKTILYPNPVQDILQISSQQPIENVTIYNTFGAIVLKQSVSSSAADIDFSSEPIASFSCTKSAVPESIEVVR